MNLHTINFSAQLFAHPLHRLAWKILTRHRAAVADYKTRQAELKQKLKALEEADDAHDTNLRSARVKELSAFMKTNQPRKTHTPTDPDKLPFGTPDGKVRAPKETEKEFHTSLFRPDPLAHMLAGPIPNGFTLPGATLPVTPTAEDLAETEDTRITPAITAQAAALGNNPVQIYNWVRNNIGERGQHRGKGSASHCFSGSQLFLNPFEI